MRFKQNMKSDTIRILKIIVLEEKAKTSAKCRNFAFNSENNHANNLVRIFDVPDNKRSDKRRSTESDRGLHSGRYTLVFKIMDSRLACHEFEPSTTKDPPSRFHLNFEREYPGGGQRPPTSFPLPPTSQEDLGLDGYLECDKGTIHLQTSIPSPGIRI
ncbi:hypothetical protein TNCV_4223431 [Trichonephila clavipes]|nr:hypothetical protein TNCV_4223431 [Trichonephila clavipes]